MNVLIKGNVVDIFAKKIYPAQVLVEGGRIRSIRPMTETGTEEVSAANLPFILPGFIDSHVHIESSMLVPSEFARLAVVHGTVATVSDPHEIANVCGMEGIEFMIRNGNTVPFKFYFGAPSCVPATQFETAGACLDAEMIERLLQRSEIHYLSEMMNFPGVLHGDEEVMRKISAARKAGKPVDGHAPGLRGKSARQYIEAGISTDHECFTAEEALDKMAYGMKVIIREGSAAKNFEALAGLLHDHYDQMMFCSDDKHPDSLVHAHINQLCSRAVAKGIDVFKVLQAACLNPVLHYHLDVGLLRENDPADFILVKDLSSFEVLETYVNGQQVAAHGQSLIRTTPVAVINQFARNPISPQDLISSGSTSTPKNIQGIPVIEALDGQLITNRLQINEKEKGDPGKDILKIVVVNRYRDAPLASSWIKNFGLKEGAIASSVAHDSHNIVAIGAEDSSLLRAINLVIEKRGGISCVGNGTERVLALPVAGLMSPEDGYQVAEAYTKIDAMAKSLGCTLSAPFMTLSFMALLVIPHLKLSDLGLFDGDSFQLIPA